MPHIKGCFTTSSYQLPLHAGTFNVDLPDDGNYAVHYVVPEGEGSVLVIEHPAVCSQLKSTTFHVIEDGEPQPDMPENCVCIGTYAVPGVGFLHVYGPRGGHDQSPDRRIM